MTNAEKMETKTEKMEINIQKLYFKEYSKLVEYAKELEDDDFCGVTMKETIEHEFRENGEEYDKYIDVDNINKMVEDSKIVSVKKEFQQIQLEFENGKILRLEYHPQFSNIPIKCIKNQKLNCLIGKKIKSIREVPDKIMDFCPYIAEFLLDMRGYNYSADASGFSSHKTVNRIYRILAMDGTECYFRLENLGYDIPIQIKLSSVEMEKKETEEYEENRSRVSSPILKNEK